MWRQYISKNLSFDYTNSTVGHGLLQEDTISVNHNWLNAANVDICWDFVKDSLVSVEQEIAEHRATLDNWVEHCQVCIYKHSQR